ncbi:MAG: C69 family dipeptidase [Pseudomonadota bacterium]
MCDTCVATGDATLDGITLFGKNSDREPNEAQYLEHVPAMDHPAGSTVRCTHITIAQADRTHGIMLSRPFWMWGAEMGVNEHGLAIGNEAVFTREPVDKQGGLTGMDLLRLALERAHTASEGIGVITNLLETYGQGGNCGFSHPFYYHSSFILADPDQSWLLETAGRHWAAMEIQGVYAISNGLTIDNQWDMASRDLVANAVKNRWCRSESDFSFARCYSANLVTSLSGCRIRRARAMDLLSGAFGTLRVQDMTAVLRDHGPGNLHSFRPEDGLVPSSICNHAGFGPARTAGQTTGSLVCHLSRDHATHFATGTSAPCTGIFKPVWVDTPLPDGRDIPAGTWDKDSLFWTHELLHRLTLKDYNALKPLYSKPRDLLESGFMDKATAGRKADLQVRADLVQNCWSKARDAEKDWLKRVRDAARKNRTGLFYSMKWNTLNRKAGIAGQLS